MKKLLSILASVGMVGTTGATVVACKTTEDSLEVDYSKLKTAITNAEQAIADNVNPNPDAEATLNEAIDVAQKVVDNVNATQAEVDSATQILEAAIETFTEATETNFDELKATITNAEQVLDEGKDRHPGAEEKFKKIISVAQSVLNNENAAQDDVDNTVKLLKVAIENFQAATQADYTSLIATIADAEQAIADNVNPNEEAEASLGAAITMAQKVVNEASSSQGEVDNAITVLNTAIENFQTVTATKYEELNATIAAANKVLEENVDADQTARETLEAAIDVAQNIVNQASSSQIEVDDAVTTLNAAIQEFENTIGD